MNFIIKTKKTTTSTQEFDEIESIELTITYGSSICSYNSKKFKKYFRR